MRFLGTITHGILDYFISILLIISPWIFEFYKAGTETVIPILVALFLILINLITNYEMSFAKLIPLKVNFAFDILAGLFLLSSPWLFGFSHTECYIHIIFGILYIILGFISKTESNPNNSQTNLI